MTMLMNSWALSRMMPSSSTGGCGWWWCSLLTPPDHPSLVQEQTHCYKHLCAVLLLLEQSPISYCSLQKKRVWRKYPNTTPLVFKGFFTLCKATLKWPKFIATPFQESCTLPEVTSLKGGVVKPQNSSILWLYISCSFHFWNTAHVIIASYICILQAITGQSAFLCQSHWQNLHYLQSKQAEIRSLCALWKWSVLQEKGDGNCINLKHVLLEKRSTAQRLLLI